MRASQMSSKFWNTPMLDRRQMLWAMGAAAMTSSPPPVAAQQDPWRALASEHAGFAADVAQRLDTAIADKRISNIHGLVVLRDDQLIIERYFEGPDRARGVGD